MSDLFIWIYSGGGGGRSRNIVKRGASYESLETCGLSTAPRIFNLVIGCRSAVSFTPQIWSWSGDKETKSLHMPGNEPRSFSPQTELRYGHYNILYLGLEAIDWIQRLRIGSVAGFCEHGNEHSGSIKGKGLD
jgi:hypothetical protein